MTTVADVALLTPCPYCGQPPRSWCRTTPGGHRSSYLHEERQRPVRELWRDSFIHGIAEGLAGVMYRLGRYNGPGALYRSTAVRETANSWGVEL